MKIILFIFLVLGTYACNNLEFVYDQEKNLSNPLYGKTQINTTGKNIIFMSSYIPMFFGKSNNEEFFLSINVKMKIKQKDLLKRTKRPQT